MIVNITGKTLVFPDGTEMPPDIDPPTVIQKRVTVWEVHGIHVYDYIWVLADGENPPWKDKKGEFLALRPVAELFWKEKVGYNEDNWVYAVEGDEQDGKLIVRHLVAYS